jgi:hypothetical protein
LVGTIPATWNISTAHLHGTCPCCKRAPRESMPACSTVATHVRECWPSAHASVLLGQPGLVATQLNVGVLQVRQLLDTTQHMTTQWLWCCIWREQQPPGWSNTLRGLANGSARHGCDGDGACAALGRLWCCGIIDCREQMLRLHNTCGCLSEARSRSVM